MKWKITRQFLLTLLIIIIVSAVTFYALNVFLLWKSPEKAGNLYGFTDKAASYTLNFNSKIKWVNNRVVINKEDLDELREKQLWIQVLDEHGNEIYSRFKPSTIPAHYTPGRIIYYDRYSHRVSRYTIFTGIAKRGDRELSYIIGFPADNIRKQTISYNPGTFFIDILRLLFSTIAITFAVACISGFVFSSRLANPIAQIIKGIKELVKGNYSIRYRENGLYKSVFKNLNNLSKKLSLAEKERRKTEQVREEWIANITHDLKTPLASIKGYSELLADTNYKLSQEERVKYAGTVMNKADYISKLVEDLKLTYQLRHSLIPLKKNNENLVDILRETIIDILNNPKYINANINFNPEKEEILFKGNGLLLKRAFANIIYNAVIHNPPGTRLDVMIKKGEKIVLEIKDNGKGMNEEELENLFKRYYRGTNTQKSQEGSGLGMAIAKQIIEAHGGSIIVKSKAGVGTKVTIYL